MNTSAKTTFLYLVCAAGILLAILSVVYGSILPFMKARAYIRAVSSLGTIKSVQDMKATFDPAFELRSPVGGEELAKFTSNNLFGIVVNPSQGEAVARSVLDYIEPKMHQNNVRHLTIVGRMYFSLWMNYHKPEDLNKAEDYYLRAHDIGPRLPQPLYALFEIYHEKGDAVRMSQIGNTILSLWPEEKRIKRVEQ